ncbi:hypothetical protein A2690_01600 [Candidatus Roizmanbacteria bacterium RIFCSPHIGHO2_01_FULL_39_12b]|uniref:J domain-containing protein n=1 Tax=Candidatus Roizmanbacteria bacterium RIFCSPHIGHO2_01_FULL_39_12b TaxID=1802030 RepID=A0A1F7GB72_9BACT|nr:MAG: hypothetical protein A2690_01600 [Candidatus Roizmanbacteria bacterium RIFCSPHIGHO2_01_FULL_39_12b]OGK46117.1 MAG: hypothetical protein A3B46_02845 [Candidatus Roizmanbacteria bacterium RIFCSPLOWO2_01_FULL_39_19]
MTQTYYDILGVPQKASSAEIKAAYRKQALKWHPDRNKESQAEEKFKEINRAYEVLSDSQKKTQYDAVGHDAYTSGGFGRGAPGGGGSNYQQGPFSYTYTSTSGESPFDGFDFGGFSDPFEIFEQFFGFRNPSGGRTRKPLYQMEIDFKDIVTGATKTVSIDGKNKTIKVPAGIDHNMRMRFSDFDVQFIVKPDKRFERRGQDVISHISFPFTTAILGGTVDVPTLDGKTVKLKIKPGTTQGTMMRLKNRGLPYVNSNQKGDHYIAFEITFPEKLSHRQKELLEEFERDS